MNRLLAFEPGKFQEVDLSRHPIWAILNAKAKIAGRHFSPESNGASDEKIATTREAKELVETFDGAPKAERKTAEGVAERAVLPKL